MEIIAKTVRILPKNVNGCIKHQKDYMMSIYDDGKFIDIFFDEKDVRNILQQLFKCRELNAEIDKDNGK
jgi:hypothetical protein